MLMNVPRNLAALGKVASKYDNPRFALGCIRLRDQGNGLYRAEASDGRTLAIISGPFDDCDEPLDGQPFESDDQRDILLTADEFAKAVARIKPPKWHAALKGREKRVVLSTNDCKAAVFEFGQSTVLTQVQGKFPDTDVVLPHRIPFVRFTVDPKTMIRLLEAASAVNENQVEILYYSGALPVGVVTKNDEGQVFDGLIVPFSRLTKPPVPVKVTDAPDEDDELTEEEHAELDAEEEAEAAREAAQCSQPE